MALTVQTVRTAISRNTAAENTYPFALSSNATAGATLVLVVTADNSFSGGSQNNISGVTDTKGNTWSSIRQAPIFDNGTTNAGIQGGWFDTDQDVGTLTTGDTITVAFSSTTTVARAVVVYQITPETGMTVAYVTGNVGTGAAAANGQITTATVQIGQVVFAAYHSENVAAVTGDSDTTNGSWATQETTTVGTTTSGIRHASQYKIQTTAASTQSYDVTVTSQDRIVSYVLYKQYGLKSFAADAIKGKNYSSSLTADAVIKKAQTGSFGADAIKSASATTVSGSFTSDAIRLRPQTGSISSDAIALRLQSGSITSDAIARLARSGSWSVDAISRAIRSGVLSADAIALVAMSGVLSADAIASLTRSGSIGADAVRLRSVSWDFTSDATIGGTSNTVTDSVSADATFGLVGACVWTFPNDGDPITAMPEMRFLMPPATGSLYFWLELDRVITFDGPSLRAYKTTDSTTNWEYWNTSSWTQIVAGGVANTYAGNEARFTVTDPLESGTWYRRVRAGTR